MRGVWPREAVRKLSERPSYTAPVRHLLVRCVRALVVVLAALPAVCGSAVALGSAQLLAAVDQRAAYLNGDALAFQNPPRLLAGRIMLPLRESAALLGVSLDVQGVSVRLGRATLDLRLGQAALDGTPQPGGSVAMIGTQAYIGARLLADALGAALSFSDDGRSLTLTALRAGAAPLLAPQARFSTDKNSYAPGERVVYTDYPFDPQGADIVSRKWTGRQAAYFAPGDYTVTLQVTNNRGLTSAPFSRAVHVLGAPVDTPSSFAVKYANLGDTFADPDVLSYPALAPQGLPGDGAPLLFSDSPEAPQQSGVLYQDVVSGRARLLAYHINAMTVPARLYVLARNLDTGPVEVRSQRLGETAPTRIEGVLGQVTLLDYFASGGGGRLLLQSGQSAAVYVSPLLRPGSGVNLLQDVETSGRVELSFVLLEDGLSPVAQVLQQLPVLAADGRHQRGTFPGAVRRLRVVLGQLPARLVIGDGNFDPVLLGTDALSGTPQRLIGNYGVLYQVEVQGAAGAAVALSPRGGLYRGALQLADGPVVQALKLPRSGVLSQPGQPALLWRAAGDKLNIDFVPASGSNLPICFVFYRAAPLRISGELFKPYRP